MVRYEGEALPSGGRIALVANDALGNFAVATPIAQMLRARWAPSALHYFGGSRTAELEQASDLYDASLALLGTAPLEVFRWVQQHGPYDLVVNLESSGRAKWFTALASGESGLVCGPCEGPGGRGDLPFEPGPRGDLWRDPAWIAADLTERYPFLETGFIGEIFCRLAYLDGPVPRYRFPVQSPTTLVPDVLIATSASLPEKLWPLEKWLEVGGRLRAQGLTAGLLGAPPKQGKAFWQGGSDEDALVDSGLYQDLRGRFTLPQVVGALSRARAVLTLDNGIVHFAASTSAPTIGLFREGIHRLWAPPAENLQVLVPAPGTTVAAIEVEAVWGALRDVL